MAGAKQYCARNNVSNSGFCARTRRAASFYDPLHLPRTKFQKPPCYYFQLPASSPRAVLNPRRIPDLAVERELNSTAPSRGPMKLPPLTLMFELGHDYAPRRVVAFLDDGSGKQFNSEKVPHVLKDPAAIQMVFDVLCAVYQDAGRPPIDYDPGDVAD